MLPDDSIMLTLRGGAVGVAQLQGLGPKVQTYLMLLVYLLYLCRGNTLNRMVCQEQTIQGYMRVAVNHVFAGVKHDV